MSTKRKILTSLEGCSKKQRNVLDLEMKMKIINEFEAGKKVQVIARELNLAHSTVSTILKDKDRVKEAAKSSAGFNAIITRQRKGLIHEMEKLLVIWFDNQMKKKKPMSLLIIQAKARSIFEALKARKGKESTETFTASHGWFQRFRRRFSLHNWNMNGSQPSGQEEKKSPVVICLDLPDESCTIYKEISNVPENSQKKMRNEESMGGDVSETQKLDVSIKAKEGVWRSGRVRKRSSKLADFASTAEVDVLFRQYSDGPGSLHNDSN
ncbi:hypothetical protein OTU49_012591, partial [Cherax quadricarinatus]